MRRGFYGWTLVFSPYFLTQQVVLRIYPQIKEQTHPENEQ